MGISMMVSAVYLVAISIELSLFEFIFKSVAIEGDDLLFVTLDVVALDKDCLHMCDTHAFFLSKPFKLYYLKRNRGLLYTFSVTLYGNESGVTEVIITFLFLVC